MSEAGRGTRDCGSCGTTCLTCAGQDPGRPVAWWARDFPGGADHVREARHWIEDLLPECDPLQDILLLASELCANAVMHTRSREAGGRFSVDVEWAPELARVVIGDQGSLTVPAIGGKPGERAWMEEFGRGLWLVDELADDWGTGCHPAGRVVWIDVQRQARGGPPLQAPGDIDAVAADITAMHSAFPRATIWWGHQTQAWWAALPDAPGASSLISSLSTDGLRKLVVDARSDIRRTGSGVLCIRTRHRKLSLLLSLTNRKTPREGDDVAAMRCACGFTELADEEITDHLELVFEPDDPVGNDGRIHEETSSLTCSCGLAAITTEELDTHFLAVFTPADPVGRDGKKHEAVGAA